MEKYWLKILQVQSKRILHKEEKSKNVKSAPVLQAKHIPTPTLPDRSVSSKDFPTRKHGATGNHLSVLKCLVNGNDLSKILRKAIREGIFHIMYQFRRRMGVEGSEYLTLVKLIDDNTTKALRIAIESGVHAVEGRSKSEKRKKALVW